ncbi:MAG: hypothetical protein N2652_02985 [Kiritimatiellae bacterium]|nr:hypothetical protein [Kiritimatiellia bacterium]
MHPNESTSSLAPPPWWRSRRCADAIATAAGVVFLVLCMALPLVGPAAARGSGSPGATRAAHYPKNVTAFLLIWVLAATLTGLGIALHRGQRADRARRHVLAALITLAALLAGILIAFLTGALAA